MAPHVSGKAQALIARLEASRSVLSVEAARMRHRLDVPARVKESILARPLSWFGGSLGAGFVASLLFRGRRRRDRKGREKPRRGLLGLLAGGAFTLAQPLIREWALQALKNRIVDTTNPPSRKD